MPVQTIDAAIARMQENEQSLQPDDGVKWFNRLYLDVTKAVRDYVSAGKPIAPPFLEQLDVIFANFYFDAFDAAAGGGSLPECWAPLFEARDDKRIAPLQFAVAGMNAHIGHDLAISALQTFERLNFTPRLGCRQHQDYEAVNSILAAVEEQTKQWLLTGAIEELDHDVAPVADSVAIWSIERARDAAWIRSEVLWHVREHQELTAAYLDTLSATVGMECRALLLPRVF